MGNTFGKNDNSGLNGEIELRHFNLLRCIGKGAFGKVRIVEHKEKKKLYALKYINKLQCIKIKATQNIIRERSILEEIEHPFIVNLRFAFQDDENMFMVLDLMIGGDLRFHLERQGSFTEEMLRFYCAELGCALNYLHNKGIIHRDLKPDNILLDDKGHSHITDFNIAVHIDPNRKPRSQSGTISYMAPEVFSGKGYSYPIDWWSLGIVLYECFFGRRPFRGHSNDQISHNIVNQKEIHFSSTNYISKHPLSPSNDLLSMIKGLLIKDSTKRLGCGSNGLDEFWDHQWFKGIDWDKLENKEYTAPMIPNPDKANFDATYDLEELLLEDNPLTYRPRKKKKNKDKEKEKDKDNSDDSHNGKSNAQYPTLKSRIQNELDYIEEHFKSFDSTLFDRFSQILESDKCDAETSELFSMLEEEYKNLTLQQQNDGFGRNIKNTHGPSGKVTAVSLREKKLRIQAYRSRIKMKQDSNNDLQSQSQSQSQAQSQANYNLNQINQSINQNINGSSSNSIPNISINQGMSYMPPPPRMKNPNPPMASSMKNIYNTSGTGYNSTNISSSSNLNVNHSTPIQQNIMQQQIDELQQSYNMLQQQNLMIAEDDDEDDDLQNVNNKIQLQFPYPPNQFTNKSNTNLSNINVATTTATSAHYKSSPPPPAPPPTQPLPLQPPPIQPLPPIPNSEKKKNYSNNGSEYGVIMNRTNSNPASASTTSISTKFKRKISIGKNSGKSSSKNKSSEKQKSGSYPGLGTSNERKRQQQPTPPPPLAMKQKYKISSNLIHKRGPSLSKDRKGQNQSWSNNSSNNGSVGEKQYSNLSLHLKVNDDEYNNGIDSDGGRSGFEGKLSQSKSMNNINVNLSFNRSIEDINIFTKEEIEDLNDTIKFELSHRYVNSNKSMDDQKPNIVNVNPLLSTPNSISNSQIKNNANNKQKFYQMPIQKEGMGIGSSPLLTDEEIANIGNNLGNMYLNDSINNTSLSSSPIFKNSNHSNGSLNMKQQQQQQQLHQYNSSTLKRINHGKSYENLSLNNSYSKSLDSTGIMNAAMASTNNNFIRYEHPQPMKVFSSSKPSSLSQGNTPIHSRSNTPNSNI